ncbi:MAG: GNAT family N-acetyltransferase, partial [Erysipelotrichaceae bacterium]|nr:GNAT family N-acetyltransferase [Erysipelotrichaceae bacterium]
MLKDRIITREDADLKAIGRMYDGAFPSAERIPFFMLRRGISEENIMHGYYLDEQLIGMSYVFLKEDMAYIGYFCVAKRYRRKGYGTQILHMIMEAYPDHRIAVDIERILPQAANLEERVKRKDFYLANGFEECHVYYS